MSGEINGDQTNDPNVARAGELDCATISDALDRLGIAGQCLGIKPLDPRFRMVGRAVTFLYKPCDVEPGNVGDYIDDVPAGSVVVLDNGSREDATVWGDILTWVAHNRHVAGTVIDGACRDTALCRELGYPVYSRSYSMRTGKDRVQLDQAGIAVSIGGVRVRPGDILRGDADGVVVIPGTREEDVLRTAEDIMRAEAGILDVIRKGGRLDEARARYAYFKLQSRDETP
jgi:4-hydroxy-4-methyl-2-oxoglutarate aldolase